MIVDDQDRIKHGAPMSVGHRDIPMLNDIATLIEQCLATSNCSYPTFTSAQDDFLKTRRSFQWKYKKMLKANWNDGQKLLKKLGKWTRDYHTWKTEIVRYPLAKRISKDVIKVYMDPGDFEPSQTKMKSVIEDFWKSQDLRIQIEWATKNTLPSGMDPSQLYKIKYFDEKGGRAYVSRRDKVMALFPDVHERTVIHEFGHVIGFPDQYFRVWDSKKCQYTYESTDKDVMSKSANGLLTPNHWKSLDAAYPWNSAP